MDPSLRWGDDREKDALQRLKDIARSEPRPKLSLREVRRAKREERVRAKARKPSSTDVLRPAFEGPNKNSSARRPASRKRHLRWTLSIPSHEP